MSAKDKAKELVDKFRRYANAFYLPNDKFIYRPEIETKSAKQCALIAVDEIMKTLWNAAAGGKVNIKDSDQNLVYWDNVKEEINAL